jgi:hypothetical protein
MAIQTSFSKKTITVVFTLSTGTFDTVNNQTTVTGLRMAVEIDKGGHPSKNTAHLKIYGMLDRDMNALSSLAFRPLSVKKNLVQVLAGDLNSSSVVFQGEISEAFASFQSPPDLFFDVKAVAGYYPAIVPVPPKSYRGATSVDTIMATLASQMGYSFQNNGVNVTLDSPYLYGTAWQQAASVADAANIEFGIDDDQLFIAPRNKPRAGRAVLINADSGMKDYPIFDKNGLKVITLFNPSVQLGGLIQVRSAVKPANGVWRVHSLKHSLEAEYPNGKWLSTISASYVGGGQ